MASRSSEALYPLSGDSLSYITEIKEKYDLAMSQPPQELKYNEDGEAISTICQTNLVRVMLIRRQDSESPYSIEVEISIFPHSGQQTGTQPIGPLIHSAMSHLQYLNALHQKGMNIDILSENCLWVASQSFLKAPNQEFFEVLCPP
jgi:hypothetical protein